MYIVKFGGSAITDKTKPYTYVKGRISYIASTLRGRPAVLIHGAGSFAHPHVKTYGLTPLGIAYTKAALKRLTSYVIEELAEAGVYAMPIEPSDIFWRDTPTRLEPIKHALENGLYPLLHGDIVPADVGYVVISGDDIALQLTKALKPNAVVFLMDVDGIYTAPPGTPGASKIQRIESDIDIEGTAGIDVTGGVRKKIAVGLAIAALGIPVFYCSIMDREAVEKILEGKTPESCTMAEP
ncbi:isopentenyl phosphate kinase [Pyrobaculum islandicum DSM 4184]|uniref:Isopentenyl phosphate kinase n=1 Tax=Pyrobaculum islandicum (strain DSM 4184 / JCM 9189 / GEO3) TaxID=384616 RepID=A1RTU2_PYRIL|nr:isopentenyl phosphate kinase [Pyrobaculum islandicum]ABL88374.1 isopentenyl phosphate kinase [Pyrobaculum islandicum DSM 4184]